MVAAAVCPFWFRKLVVICVLFYIVLFWSFKSKRPFGTKWDRLGYFRVNVKNRQNGRECSQLSFPSLALCFVVAVHCIVLLPNAMCLSWHSYFAFISCKNLKLTSREVKYPDYDQLYVLWIDWLSVVVLWIHSQYIFLYRKQCAFSLVGGKRPGGTCTAFWSSPRWYVMLDVRPAKFPHSRMEFAFLACAKMVRICGRLITGSLFWWMVLWPIFLAKLKQPTLVSINRRPIRKEMSTTLNIRFTYTQAVEYFFSNRSVILGLGSETASDNTRNTNLCSCRNWMFDTRWELAHSFPMFNFTTTAAFCVARRTDEIKSDMIFVMTATKTHLGYWFLFRMV